MNSHAFSYLLYSSHGKSTPCLPISGSLVPLFHIRHCHCALCLKNSSSISVQVWLPENQQIICHIDSVMFVLVHSAARA